MQVVVMFCVSVVVVLIFTLHDSSRISDLNDRIKDLERVVDGLCISEDEIERCAKILSGDINP